MNTYIIDWGENCQGGRFGLIHASSPWDAIVKCDAIGDSSSARIAPMSIKEDADDGIPYVECDQNDIFTGRLFEEAFRWRSATDLNP